MSLSVPLTPQGGLGLNEALGLSLFLPRADGGGPGTKGVRAGGRALAEPSAPPRRSRAAGFLGRRGARTLRSAFCRRCSRRDASPAARGASGPVVRHRLGREPGGRGPHHFPNLCGHFLYACVNPPRGVTSGKIRGTSSRLGVCPDIWGRARRAALPGLKRQSCRPLSPQCPASYGKPALLCFSCFFRQAFPLPSRNLDCNVNGLVHFAVHEQSLLFPGICLLAMVTFKG